MRSLKDMTSNSATEKEQYEAAAAEARQALQNQIATLTKELTLKETEATDEISKLKLSEQKLKQELDELQAQQSALAQEVSSLLCIQVK